MVAEGELGGADGVGVTTGVGVAVWVGVGLATGGEVGVTIEVAPPGVEEGKLPEVGLLIAAIL